MAVRRWRSTRPESANSITVDTTTASGTLTLNAGVTLNNNTWNFGGVGSNTYLITGGTGLTSVASGGTISFNNFNGGNVTITSPIVANGTNAVLLNGTGTTILNAANTYTGATTIGSGTVQLGNVTALGTTAAGTTVNASGTLDLNGLAVGAEALTLSGGALINSSGTTASLTGAITLSTGTMSTVGGAGNITLSTGVISGSGLLTKTGTGTLTLSAGGNTFTGNIIVNGGTLATGSEGNGTNSAFGSQTSVRTITINPGATVALNTNNVFGGGATALTALPSFVIQGGTLRSNNYNILGNVTLGDGGTLTCTVAATSGYTGLELKGGSTVTVANALGTTLGSSITSPGLNLAGTVTFNVGSVTGSSTADLTVSSVVANASADNGGVAGSLIKMGDGTLAFTSSTSFTGTTTINGGTLVFGTGSGTNTYGGSQIVINNGATMQVKQIGSSARYDFGTLTFSFGASGGGRISTVGAGTNWVAQGNWTFKTNGGLKNTIDGAVGMNMNGGHSVVLDVTRGTDPASDLDITIGIENTNGSLTKTGDGIATLAGANTYSGATTVSAGTLVVSGSLSGTANVSVASTATLASGATGSITTATAGDVSVTGSLAPGNAGSVGTLTLAPGAGGKLNFLSGATFKFDISGTNSDSVAFSTSGDWLTGSGNVTLALSGITAGDYGNTYTVFQNATTAGFTFANITGYDSADFSANFTQVGNNYQVSFTAVPEPGSAVSLLGGLGCLLGLQRFRRRRCLRNGKRQKLVLRIISTRPPM